MSDAMESDEVQDPDSENWDPSPSEREYYRSKSDGQLAWKVRREGKDCVRLDRAAQELIFPLDGKWILDENRKSLAIGQLAQINFEADKVLCRYIGLVADSRKEWANLPDDERIAWMRKGPRKDPLRRALWVAIHETLKDYTS